GRGRGFPPGPPRGAAGRQDVRGDSEVGGAYEKPTKKSAAPRDRRSLLPPIVVARASGLARCALVLEDRAEQFPALAVELHHLQLLVDAVIIRRGVDGDARQQQIELNVLQAGGLLQHVLAGQV